MGARARPEVICFYRFGSEDEALTVEHERLALSTLTEKARDGFLSDHAPILSVLTKRDMLEEIESARERGSFSTSDEKVVESLKLWVHTSRHPVIGYQIERVAKGAPNKPSPEALRDEPSILPFYRLSSSLSDPVPNQEAFILDQLTGGFRPDVAPYLTVRARRDVIDDLPRIEEAFRADDLEKESLRLLKVWLSEGSESWVGYQYEAP